MAQKASNASKALQQRRNFFSLSYKKRWKIQKFNISACKRPTENLNPFLESLFRMFFSLDNGNFVIPTIKEAKLREMFSKKSSMCLVRA